ncbi:MAG: hypothetical protein ACLTYW_11565 [Collinsella sp.]
MKFLLQAFDGIGDIGLRRIEALAAALIEPDSATAIKSEAAGGSSAPVLSSVIYKTDKS